MSDIFEYTGKNKRAWDEIARVRAEKQPSASFFVAGNATLDEREVRAAGDVRGKRLLHLQCATGEDTLSWAVMGAEATGVDISEVQVELAREKATEAGLAVRFVAADVYDLPTDLQDGSFDYVYTGKGVMVWLPDLTRWAEVIVAALKPGGRFVLFEEHPVASCLWVEEGRLVVASDYFGREKVEFSHGWGHFKGGEEARETKAEFAWPLGDIVTALARAGLRIERLEEFPAERGWRFGEEVGDVRRLPGDFVLVARKE